MPSTARLIKYYLDLNYVALWNILSALKLKKMFLLYGLTFDMKHLWLSYSRLPEQKSSIIAIIAHYFLISAIIFTFAYIEGIIFLANH